MGPDKYAVGLELLEEWENISYEDAIFLLSRRFAMNGVYNRKFWPEVEVYGYFYGVRKYAVKIFEELDLSKLTFLLLQLVTALRYEDYCWREEEMETTHELKRTEEFVGGSGKAFEKKSSPLLKFLLKKACENAKSAS